MSVHIHIRSSWLAPPAVTMFARAMKVAEDTYQVSANASPARGGITGAREMGLRNAHDKCDSLGKKIVATITFTCK